MSKNIIFEAIWKIWWFRFNKIERFIKFSIVGGIGAIIDFSVLILFVEVFSFQILIANTISFLIALVNNFLLNKYWTWNNKNSRYIKQFIKYIFISVIGFILNTILMWLLMQLGLWYIGIKIVIITIVSLWNFFVNNFWTFKK